ncbi:MAG: DUF89 family protein [Acidobacteria bacterium]|nr:DUF89 family protein [Acidobacteriota bacterium]
MKTYLDCIPCFFKQALFAARAATHDENRIKEVLDKVSGLVPDIPLESPPPETARYVYGAVRDITGVSDPFRTHKDKSIERALQLYDSLKSAVTASEDPLRTAVHIAIAGNVIDFGAAQHFDLDNEMKDVLKKKPAIDDYESFRQSVETGGTVLFLGDNAGETVFDRILIETLRKNTVYAVREIPIINDATMEDAVKSGIDKVARIISSGCDAPGTILKRCSREFLEHYRTADVVISKGQGNLETLSEETRPIFFLLKVKCRIAAHHLGAEEGSLVLKDNRLQVGK